MHRVAAAVVLTCFCSAAKVGADPAPKLLAVPNCGFDPLEAPAFAAGCPPFDSIDPTPSEPSAMGVDYVIVQRSSTLTNAWCEEVLATGAEIVWFCGMTPCSFASVLATT